MDDSTGWCVARPVPAIWPPRQLALDEGWIPREFSSWPDGIPRQRDRNLLGRIMQPNGIRLEHSEGSSAFRLGETQPLGSRILRPHSTHYQEWRAFLSSHKRHCDPAISELRCFALTHAYWTVPLLAFLLLVGAGCTQTGCGCVMFVCLAHRGK